MSRIDDELEQAVRAGEAPSSDAARGDVTSAANARRADPGGSSGGRNSPRSGSLNEAQLSDGEEPKRSWWLLAGLLAIGGGVLLLVFNSGDNAVAYAYQVDELKEQAAELGERQVRVQGVLVSGTLDKQDEPCLFSFLMHKAGAKGSEPLKVEYPQCIVPDTFRDVKGVDVEVTAEGRMSPDGYLLATKIFAKCPSKYEARDTTAALGKTDDHGGGAPKPEFIAPRAEGVASTER